MFTPKELITDLWPRGDLPIVPNLIAGKMNIIVAYEDMPDCCCRLTFRNRPSIIVNSNDNILRQQFSIAHAIGHYCMGDKIVIDTPEDYDMYVPSSKERACNNFALKLLMPSDYVKAVYWGRGVDNLNELARMFNVGKVAMVKRLRQLKILQFN